MSSPNKKLCYGYVSQNLVNSRNNLYDKSATNRMELEGYSCRICMKQPRLDCRIGVVNKLDRRRRRRRVLLTTRSTCRGEIFQVRSLGQSARGKYANFWRYANFLTAQCGIGGRKPLCQNPARFVQSFRYNTGL